MRILFLFAIIFHLGCSGSQEGDVAKLSQALILAQSVPTSATTSRAIQRAREMESSFENLTVATDCAITGSSSSFTVTCTFNSDATVSCGTDYTIIGGSSATITVTQPQSDLYQVSYSFDGRISGGDIDTALNLVCSYSADHSYDAENNRLANNGNVDNCTTFSCTLGGTALGCESFKSSYGAAGCTGN